MTLELKHGVMPKERSGNLMDETPNYNLQKPAYDDLLDVEVLNKNMDIVDAELKALAIEDTVFKGNIKDLNSSLATINSTLKTLQTTDNNLQTNINNIKNIKGCRFVIGTKTAGHTAKDCDYLCDGTDDQVEINNAINALPSTGGEVKLLDGTYNITSDIVINKSNVQFRGSGRATILKRMSNNTSHLVRCNAVNYSLISDFIIEGNKSTYKGIGLWASGSYVRISNVIARNNSDTGFYINNLYDSIIEGNYIINNDSFGIDAEPVFRTKIINNHVVNSGVRGLYLSGYYNVVANNYCTGNYEGIMYTSSSSGNKHSVLIGNCCVDNEQYGIWANGTTEGIVIVGNICYCPSGQYAIYLGSATKKCLVAGNSCYGKSISLGGSGHISSGNLT